MYHIIKKNGKDLLLCSGAMGEADFIKFKHEFGIERDQIKFVPQIVITEILKAEMPTLEQVNDLLSKMPRERCYLMQKASLILWNIYDVVGMFSKRLSHVGRKYYTGRMVRCLLEDKKGNGVYCDKCRNIANGIEEGRVLGLTYRIPLCKRHLSD